MLVKKNKNPSNLYWNYCNLDPLCFMFFSLFFCVAEMKHWWLVEADNPALWMSEEADGSELTEGIWTLRKNRKPHEIPRRRISKIILNILEFLHKLCQTLISKSNRMLMRKIGTHFCLTALGLTQGKNLQDGNAIFRKFDRFLSLDSRPGFPEQQLNTGWILIWSGTHPEETAINNREHIRAYGPYYLSGQSCGDNVTGTGWGSRVQLNIHRSTLWY